MESNFKTVQKSVKKVLCNNAHRFIIEEKGGINMATEAQKRAVRKYENNNYRLNIVFPKGTKERIEELSLGKSNSAFIRDVVLSELDRLEKK